MTLAIRIAQWISPSDMHDRRSSDNGLLLRALSSFPPRHRRLQRSATPATAGVPSNATTNSDSSVVVKSTPDAAEIMLSASSWEARRRRFGSVLAITRLW